MEDEEIYQLYWKRSEQAITATHEKYGSWCQGIAYRILNTREETEECVSGAETPQGQLDAKEVILVIRKFLSQQPETQRNIFLRRYWHMSSIRDIAAAYSMSESKVTSLLFRQRKQLKTMLEKAGINL